MHARLCRSSSFLPSLLTVVLVSAAIGSLAGAPLVAHASGPYVVNVSYDAPDSALGDGICYDGIAGCTLRAAIQQASHDSSPTTITFDGSLAGSTLYLSNTYGSLIISGSGITIDGYTGPGNYPPIINGSSLLGKNVFEIQGNSNMLYYLVVRSAAAHASSDLGHGIFVHDPSGSGYASYNTLDSLIVFDNAHSGIVISGDAGGGGRDNWVIHSLIGGANWLQTACSTDGNAWEGIEVRNGADNAFVNSNRIVCNGNSGIWLNGGVGGQISNTLIQSNAIGTDGTHDMGNGLSGITDSYATGTQILSNQISGNGTDGVWLQGSTSATLTGNRIGVTASGTVSLPNGYPDGYSGVVISDGANGNTVGSPTDAGASNTISGNWGCGVEILWGAYNNVLDGNIIGLSPDGNTVLSNGLAGVSIVGATNNALSSATATVHQYISGNAREGVYIDNASVAIINWATYIGVNPAGMPVGNGLEGVRLTGGSTYAIIRPGVVKYNGAAGIALDGDTTVGNSLTPVHVSSNVGLAIDLGNDGHTPNDPGDADTGPNTLLNYPVVHSNTANRITGTTCPDCEVRVYQAVGDPTVGAGGGDYLTTAYSDPVTGAWEYTFGPSVTAVTLVACQPSPGLNCSEMGPRIERIAKVFLPLALR